jgi:hypothetical protein
MRILSRPNPAALDPETDARIKAAFPGIVAGDSSLPEGWTPRLADGPTQRQRRVTRRRKAV